MLGEKRNVGVFDEQPSGPAQQSAYIEAEKVEGELRTEDIIRHTVTAASAHIPDSHPAQVQAQAGEPSTADSLFPRAHSPRPVRKETPTTEETLGRGLNAADTTSPRAHNLFFTPEREAQSFSAVLQDVQEYISSNHSTLIIDSSDEDAKAQIKRYITKYVQDRRVSVQNLAGDALVDALYTEMAEFGFLTKYIFGTGIEEINVNSWRDIEVLYATGESKKLEESMTTASGCARKLINGTSGGRTPVTITR